MEIKQASDIINPILLNQNKRGIYDTSLKRTREESIKDIRSMDYDEARQFYDALGVIISANERPLPQVQTALTDTVARLEYLNLLAKPDKGLVDLARLNHVDSKAEIDKMPAERVKELSDQANDSIGKTFMLGGHERTLPSHLRNQLHMAEKRHIRDSRPSEELEVTDLRWKTNDFHEKTFSEASKDQLKVWLDAATEHLRTKDSVFELETELRNLTQGSGYTISEEDLTRKNELDQMIDKVGNARSAMLRTATNLAVQLAKGTPDQEVENLLFDADKHHTIALMTEADLDNALGHVASIRIETSKQGAPLDPQTKTLYSLLQERKDEGVSLDYLRGERNPMEHIRKYGPVELRDLEAQVIERNGVNDPFLNTLRVARVTAEGRDGEFTVGFNNFQEKFSDVDDAKDAFASMKNTKTLEKQAQAMLKEGIHPPAVTMDDVAHIAGMNDLAYTIITQKGGSEMIAGAEGDEFETIKAAFKSKQADMLDPVLRSRFEVAETMISKISREMVKEESQEVAAGTGR